MCRTEISQFFVGLGEIGLELRVGIFQLARNILPA
jgi:hypothetical protein